MGIKETRREKTRVLRLIKRRFIKWENILFFLKKA
jgi:hypothetical protein